MHSAESWRPVLSVPGLEVSDLGRIKVTPYAREMPYGGVRWYGGHAWTGCLVTDVSRPRRIFRFRGRTLKVHRLVCEAFQGPPPLPNADVIHRNGNTVDNRAANLRWATRADVLRQERISSFTI